MLSPRELQRIIKEINGIQTEEFALRLVQRSMENYMRDQLIMKLQNHLGVLKPKYLVIPEWKYCDISIHSSDNIKFDKPSLVIELKWSTVGYALMGKEKFIEREIRKDVEKIKNLNLPTDIPKYQIFFMRHPHELPTPRKNYYSFIRGYDHHKKGSIILQEYNVANKISSTIEQLLYQKMDGYYQNIDSRIKTKIFQIPSGNALGTDWSIYVTIASIP
ncbi:hypothetical protein [Cytobacillus praedii]|uniref:hypothetical protein n=1 Tax=Cytobacillus praedii TaxID=1742358 RepID=UPI002E238A66|nr:hypothetical protein [Cytobacillus praedii]